MPTVAELKSRIIRATNHTYTDSFHMLDLLNDALNQLTDGAKMEGSEDIYVSAGVTSYDLPATFKAPIALIEGDISNPAQVYEQVDINEYRFGYALFNGQLYLKPEPPEDKTLTLYFYKYAAQLIADTDVPEIDAQWHDLLATYAAGMILLLPNMQTADKGLSDRLMGRWEDGKKSFRESMMRKGKRSSVTQKTRW